MCIGRMMNMLYVQKHDCEYVVCIVKEWWVSCMSLKTVLHKGVSMVYMLHAGETVAM